MIYQFVFLSVLSLGSSLQKTFSLNGILRKILGSSAISDVFANLQ